MGVSLDFGPYSVKMLMVSVTVTGRLAESPAQRARERRLRTSCKPSECAYRRVMDVNSTYALSVSLLSRCRFITVSRKSLTMLTLHISRTHPAIKAAVDGPLDTWGLTRPTIKPSYLLDARRSEADNGHAPRESNLL